MIGRTKPQPPGEPTPSAALAGQLTARHDQALARIDEGLRAAGSNRQMVDVLLDVRNLLRPPGPQP